MKKIVKFSKLFTPIIILYAVFLATGIVLLCTKGVNKGVDFQSGLVSQVRFAPTVLTLNYDGPDSVSFSRDEKGVYIVRTSISAESSTDNFLFTKYKTIGDFVAASSKVSGLTVHSLGFDTVSLASVFTSSTDGTKLSSDRVLKLYSLEAVSAPMTHDDVQQALASVEGLSIQQVGIPADRTFQFRIANDNAQLNTRDNLKAKLTEALSASFGAGNYAFLSTDFMGSQFSGALVRQSALLVIFSVVLIFLYVMIRFNWNFSLAAVIALLFDTFTMVVYMSLTQIEFSTFTIAALLTIIGYSVNDTVVMFDRIRENTRLFPNMLGTDIIDKSITEVLSRSIITTVTTVVAVLILFLFTRGNIQNFANVLLVGLVSGLITSLLVVPAIMNLTCATKKGYSIIRSNAATPQNA